MRSWSFPPDREALKVTDHNHLSAAVQNQIRAWRLHRGLTQEQLGEKANTTSQTIGRLERGTRRVSDVWIARLTNALRCTPTQLLSEPPDDLIRAQHDTSADSESMPVDQLTVQLLRDLNAQIQQQNQILADLAQVLERLERILTLPERTRAKSAR